MQKIALCILTLSCCLQAQSDNSSLKDRLRREILEKQKMMREGRVIRSNVRVTVRLTNNARLKGVVKGGRVIERVDGLQFVPADVASPGAGIRLWYYNNTNSYIFIPFATIKHHNIGEKLSDEEIGKIEDRIASAKQLADERRQLLAKETKEAEASGPDAKSAKQALPAKPGGASANKPVKPSMDPELAKLLAEFPPEDGWSQEKYEDIQQKKVVLGVYPDKKSSRFLEKFEDWSRAKVLAKVLKQESVLKSLQDVGAGKTKKKD